MKAQFIKENIQQFKRGIGPKDSLNLGITPQIKEWMEYARISPDAYNINSDLTIDTTATIVLMGGKYLFPGGKFPDYIKFRNSYFDMDLDACGLVSLKGCPITVGGYFSCQMNPLKNLIGGPENVEMDYYANSTTIISIEGIAKKIGGNFDITMIDAKISEDEIRGHSEITGFVYIDK